MQTRVFISHQWRDKQVADTLKSRIEELTTADVWIDYRNLRPGDKIGESIGRVLEEIDVVLVVWSPHSAASQGVAAEVEEADRLGKRIIPCFITYTDDGAVDPPLNGPLSQYVGIDFHHHDTGVAALTSLLLELQDEQADLGMGGDPRMRLLHTMREASSYLANYRNARGVDDDRGYWISQIVGELERYVEETGDVDLAARLAGGLELIRETDPEGYSTAMNRLHPLLGDAIRSSAPEAVKRPQSVDPEESPPVFHPEEPERDLLDRMLLEGGVDERDLGDHRSAIHAYLAAAEAALDAMATVVSTVQSPAGIQVVSHLNGYLNESDDLIPDHHGAYGYLDDAWLILNTAYRLIESGALTVQQVPIDWAAVASADALVRALIPVPALGALEQQMLQMLQMIATEIASYQPWMTPTGTGYSPTMAWGSSWEDQMAQGMAELGISW